MEFSFCFLVGDLLPLIPPLQFRFHRGQALAAPKVRVGELAEVSDYHHERDV